MSSAIESLPPKERWEEVERYQGTILLPEVRLCVYSVGVESFFSQDPADVARIEAKITEVLGCTPAKTKLASNQGAEVEYARYSLTGGELMLDQRRNGPEPRTLVRMQTEGPIMLRIGGFAEHGVAYGIGRQNPRDLLLYDAADPGIIPELDVLLDDMLAALPSTQ